MNGIFWDLKSVKHSVIKNNLIILKFLLRVLLQSFFIDRHNDLL